MARTGSPANGGRNSEQEGVGRPIVTSDEIQNMVRVVGRQRVLLDSDLARLYGVTPKRLNEQVARNRNRLPGDFAYQPTQQ